MDRTTLCQAADAAVLHGTTGVLAADPAAVLATPALLAVGTAVGAAGGIVTADVMGGMMGGKDGEEDPAAPPIPPESSYRGASAPRLLALR